MVALETEIQQILRESQALIYGIRVKGLIDPFYIGSTRQSLKIRFAGHLQEIKKGKHKNSYFYNKARKVGIENIEIYEIERVERSRQFIREHELINEYLKNGAYLTNIQLVPHPPNPDKDYLDPQIIARNVFLALLAPVDCEIPENQALYSKVRTIARQCVNEMLFRHRADLLALLSTRKVAA